MSPLIDLRGVDVRLDGRLVLDGIDLAVEAGDFLGLIGPNGSGKTTLLRVTLGLLPADAGTVRLFGAEPRAFRQWHRLGYVPQRASIDPGLPATVTEVVATGLVSRLGLLARVRAPDRARVAQALVEVGMAEHAFARIGTLSAGQQQRVLIARALVPAPELLVLDEPTEGIDPEAQAAFYGLLHRLNREHGVTLVMVSHDIAAVAREVTKLACLNRRLVYHGPPAAALGGDTLSALYGASARIVAHGHR